MQARQDAGSMAERLLETTRPSPEQLAAPATAPRGATVRSRGGACAAARRKKDSPSAAWSSASSARRAASAASARCRCWWLSRVGAGALPGRGPDGRRRGADGGVHLQAGGEVIMRINLDNYWLAGSSWRPRLRPRSRNRLLRRTLSRSASRSTTGSSIALPIRPSPSPCRRRARSFRKPISRCAPTASCCAARSRCRARCCAMGRLPCRCSRAAR